MLAHHTKIGLHKRLEDHLQLAGGNADAGVADHEVQTLRHGLGRRCHRQLHTAEGGELDRVRQQVAQCLGQALAVTQHSVRQARCQDQAQLQAFFFGPGGEQMVDVLENRV